MFFCFCTKYAVLENLKKSAGGESSRKKQEEEGEGKGGGGGKRRGEEEEEEYRRRGPDGRSRERKEEREERRRITDIPISPISRCTPYIWGWERGEKKKERRGRSEKKREEEEKCIELRSLSLFRVVFWFFLLLLVSSSSPHVSSLSSRLTPPSSAFPLLVSCRSSCRAPPPSYSSLSHLLVFPHSLSLSFKKEVSVEGGERKREGREWRRRRDLTANARSRSLDFSFFLALPPPEKVGAPVPNPYQFSTA